MSWSLLIRTALLGLDRSALPPALAARLQALGLPVQDDQTGLLLQGAAYFRVLRRAASPLEAATDNVFNHPAADLSGENPCSAAAVKALGQITGGPFEPALREWLELAAYRQQHLPPEFLPALFSRCLKEVDLWPLVRSVIGPRGLWLLKQHPAGIVLYGHDKPEDWNTGAREIRVGILAFLRQANPQQALELLQSSWLQENAADRQLFLAQLSKGLSLSDEAFLENCLDDKRKEIRQLAAKLLAELPESALSKRLFQAASDIIQIKDGTEISLIIPKEIPQHLLRDGISFSSKGAEHNWLWQLLERVPPSKWTTHFKKSAETLSRLFVGNNWSRQLIPALSNAALLFDDTEWISAIVAQWLRPRSLSAEWQSAQGQALLARLPRETFNQLAWQAFSESGALVDEDSLACTLLSLPYQRWEERLALVFIRNFQEYIAKSNVYAWNAWHYRRLLNHAAYACHPKLQENFLNGWPVFSPIWPKWSAEVTRFQQILNFRQEMRQAFQ